MADVEHLRTKILEQFKNGGEKPQKQKKIAAEKSAPDTKSDVAMDDTLMGQMLEHQQRVTAVDVEAQKVKRQRIKETLNKPLLKSLFRSM